MQLIAEKNTTIKKPRIGFLGMGWIGISRMEAILKNDLVDVAAIADPDLNVQNKIKAKVPKAAFFTDLNQLLDSQVDAVVIATPSAMHSEQSRIALESGAAVFCQKPLGRNYNETSAVINTAKKMNLLLGIDFSYRYVRSLQVLHDYIISGGIGSVYAVNLIFHNAYGPDKKWFYDPILSGGGCVIDLGIHMIDLALWTLNFPKVSSCSSRLFSQSKQFERCQNKVEDYAVAQLTIDNRIVINLACSWNLSAGCDAIIKAEFYGNNGAAVWENVNGSFYDFTSRKMKGTSTESLYTGRDDWFGKAASDWSNKLVKNKLYDAQVESANQVAKVIDMIYQS